MGIECEDDQQCKCFYRFITALGLHTPRERLVGAPNDGQHDLTLSPLACIDFSSQAGPRSGRDDQSNVTRSLPDLFIELRERTAPRRAEFDGR